MQSDLYSSSIIESNMTDMYLLCAFLTDLELSASNYKSGNGKSFFMS